MLFKIPEPHSHAMICGWQACNRIPYHRHGLNACISIGIPPGFSTYILKIGGFILMITCCLLLSALMFHFRSNKICHANFTANILGNTHTHIQCHIAISMANHCHIFKYDQRTFIVFINFSAL